MMFSHIRTSLSLLSQDVLQEIFSIVYDTSYTTVRSLLLTNRLFHSLTRQLLYRYVALNMGSSDLMEEIQSWLTDPDKSAISKSIRHIRIDRVDRRSGHKALINDRSLRVVGNGWLTAKERDTGTEWSTIAKLISKTSQLQSLTFSCSEAIPLVLLESIHNYPTNICLHVSSWIRTSPAALHDDPTELALMGSPSLRSLQATISNPGRNAKDLRIPAFWRLVRSAPNLQTVMLNISHGGCVVRWDREPEIREWKALASKFEHTSLLHNAAPCKIKNLKISGVNLSEWKGGDLSQVTNLDYKGVLPLQVLSSLTSLTHLTMRLNTESRIVNDLLVACSPLTSLSLVGWKQGLQLDTLFTHHGHSLRSLALHELELHNLETPRDTLSIDELRCIRDRCPRLDELSIDLNFPENPVLQSDHLIIIYHEDVYNTLVTFPFLRRLQLNYNLGISSHKPQYWVQEDPASRLPSLDKGFVEKVWKAVNIGRTASRRLQELRITQGEAQRATGFGYPAGWVTWERNSHHWFKATPAERDDQPNGIDITQYRDIPDFGYDVWREYQW